MTNKRYYFICVSVSRWQQTQRRRRVWKVEPDKCSLFTVSGGFFTTHCWPFKMLGNARQTWINEPQKPQWCLEGFLHPLIFTDPRSYLGRRLQAVLQVFARWIVSKEGKARQLRLPHADPLVQRVEELFHCGGAVETHHLRERRHISETRTSNTAQAQHLVTSNSRCTVQHTVVPHWDDKLRYRKSSLSRRSISLKDYWQQKHIAAVMKGGEGFHNDFTVCHNDLEANWKNSVHAKN